MITYRNSKELVGKTLNVDDRVLFVVDGVEYMYWVKDDYLSCPNRNNSVIFEALSLNKIDFCSTHYGYLATKGSWPVTKNRDFEALTRVVGELLSLSDNGGYMGAHIGTTIKFNFLGRKPI